MLLQVHPYSSDSKGDVGEVRALPSFAKFGRALPCLRSIVLTRDTSYWNILFFKSCKHRSSRLVTQAESSVALADTFPCRHSESGHYTTK